MLTAGANPKRIQLLPNRMTQKVSRIAPEDLSNAIVVAAKAPTKLAVIFCITNTYAWTSALLAPGHPSR
jgi:hypothetical protein